MQALWSSLGPWHSCGNRHSWILISIIGKSELRGIQCRNNCSQGNIGYHIPNEAIHQNSDGLLDSARTRCTAVCFLALAWLPVPWYLFHFWMLCSWTFDFFFLSLFLNLTTLGELSSNREYTLLQLLQIWAIHLFSVNDCNKVWFFQFTCVF